MNGTDTIRSNGFSSDVSPGAQPGSPLMLSMPLMPSTLPRSKSPAMRRIAAAQVVPGDGTIRRVPSVPADGNMRRYPSMPTMAGDGRIKRAPSSNSIPGEIEIRRVPSMHSVSGDEHIRLVPNSPAIPVVNGVRRVPSMSSVPVVTPKLHHRTQHHNGGVPTVIINGIVLASFSFFSKTKDLEPL